MAADGRARSLADGAAFYEFTAATRTRTVREAAGKSSLRTGNALFDLLYALALLVQINSRPRAVSDRSLEQVCEPPVLLVANIVACKRAPLGNIRETRFPKKRGSRSTSPMGPYFKCSCQAKFNEGVGSHQ